MLRYSRPRRPIGSSRSIASKARGWSLASGEHGAQGAAPNKRLAFGGADGPHAGRRGRARSGHPGHPQRRRADPPGTRGGHRGQPPRGDADQETRATRARVHHLPSRHRDRDHRLAVPHVVHDLPDEGSSASAPRPVGDLGAGLCGYSCRLGIRHIGSDRRTDLETGERGRLGIVCPFCALRRSQEREPHSLHRGVHARGGIGLS